MIGQLNYVIWSDICTTSGYRINSYNSDAYQTSCNPISISPCHVADKLSFRLHVLWVLYINIGEIWHLKMNYRETSSWLLQADSMSRCMYPLVTTSSHPLLSLSMITTLALYKVCTMPAIQINMTSYGRVPRLCLMVTSWLYRQSGKSKSILSVYWWSYIKVNSY